MFEEETEQPAPCTGEKGPDPRLGLHGQVASHWAGVMTAEQGE